MYNQPVISPRRPQPSLLTLEDFFRGYEPSRQLFTALQKAVDAAGPCELRITKSQIAFRRRKAFAWAWIPAKYLHGDTAPLVLSILLPARNPSPRWKEVIEPYPGRFMHHLELFTIADIDAQVEAWLRQAWKSATQ